MESWNRGISFDFSIQASLLLFKVPTGQPQMIIVLIVNLDNYTYIVTSWHENRAYSRRRCSLGARKDFTFFLYTYSTVLLDRRPHVWISDGSKLNDIQLWPPKRNWSWIIYERFYREKTTILMSWSRNRRLRNWIKFYLEQ